MSQHSPEHGGSSTNLSDQMTTDVITAVLFTPEAATLAAVQGAFDSPEMLQQFNTWEWQRLRDTVIATRDPQLMRKFSELQAARPVRPLVSHIAASSAQRGLARAALGQGRYSVEQLSQLPHSMLDKLSESQFAGMDRDELERFRHDQREGYGDTPSPA